MIRPLLGQPRRGENLELDFLPRIQQRRPSRQRGNEGQIDGGSFLFFEKMYVKRVAALGQQHVAILRQHAGGFHIHKGLFHGLIPLANLPQQRGGFLGNRSVGLGAHIEQVIPALAMIL